MKEIKAFIENGETPTPTPGDGIVYISNVEDTFQIKIGKSLKKPAIITYRMSDIEKLLNRHSVRPTAMRILIYRFMARKERAVTLTEIENAFVKADRATLSRSIKTFETSGIVHQIDDGTGIPKYALCESGCNCEIHQDLHIHFHCTNCDETICLTDHKIPHINLPEGFMAENVNLVAKGMCDKCSAV